MHQFSKTKWGIVWSKDTWNRHISRIFVNIGLDLARCEKLSKTEWEAFELVRCYWKEKKKNPFFFNLILIFFWSATSSSDLALGSNGHGSSKTRREAARHCDLSSTNHRSSVFPRLRVFILTLVLFCPNVFIFASDS